MEEPPWLRRHREALRMAEIVAKLKRLHVYTAEEIVEAVGKRYRRIKPRKPGAWREFELRRLEMVYNTASSRLRVAASMPSMSELPEFHRLLVEAFLGDEYENALRKVRKSLRLIRSFWDEYRVLLLSAEDRAEAARLRREASGRILSVVRRLKRSLETLRRARDELVHTHVVSEGLPVAVVAGIPNSGKSTLVRALSTAEPETAPYPFTTKTVIVGKFVEDGISAYLVDTPGILERPQEHRNEIERKALAALRALPDIVVYIYDPSAERLQDVEEQTTLLRDVYETIVRPRRTGLLILLGKADMIPAKEPPIPPDIASYPGLCSPPLPVSPLKGINMDKLREALASCIKRHAPWLFGD